MSNARWFEQYRMDWIAETLHIFGFINREHLQRKFGTSSPQASIDLNRFMTRNPNAMRYNLQTKRYEAVRNKKEETTGNGAAVGA